MTERKTRGNREDCVDPVSALSRDNSIQETHRTISRKMSQPSAASRPTVEKTKHATVSSRGLFRETARMKHGAKQSKRHEMSTASIARTGCPESTPIAECCVDATTTQDLSCKRRRAARHRQSFTEAILTTESGSVGNAADAVETRHANHAAQNGGADYVEVSRANDSEVCRVGSAAPPPGFTTNQQRWRQIRMYKLRRYIHKQTHHIANRRSE